MNTEIIGVTGDIKRNLQTLFGTPEGTLVNDRKYGINWDGVDSPPEVAEAMLMAEITEKVERYEPRARVEDIIPESSAEGVTTIKVVIRYANQESTSG